MNAPLRVALLDLGVGNLRSVARSLELAATEHRLDVIIDVTREATRVAAADRIVVPGQGAFRDASRALQTGLGDVLRRAIDNGVPYLGICLGLQLLFEGSEEAPDAPGLGVFAGQTVRLANGAMDEQGAVAKIPHMGWNPLELRPSAPAMLRRACEVSPWFYFVHSYQVAPAQRELIAATVTHGPHQITAAVARGNLLATQFHPEKSQRGGLVLLGEFLAGTEMGTEQTTLSSTERKACDATLASH